MVDGLNLAGVIGTWVAALLAIVALIGIVGPLLVWRATTTDRHKALNALDVDNGGFITKGIPVGSNIRLFRQVEAPILNTAPRVAGLALAWNRQARRASQASASWVKLGLVLKAYNFPFALGNSLVIENKATWLPVNREWIMVLGIMGGFGHRADHGKLPTRSHTQAIPGAWHGKESNFYPGWMTGHPRWAASRHHAPGATISDGSSQYRALYGVLGTLYMQKMQRSNSTEYTVDVNQVQRAMFNQHTVAEIGDILPHHLPLSSLFWLAVGCLPAADGRIFSLEDVLSIPFEAPPEESPEAYNGPVSPRVHFDDYSGSDDDTYRYQPEGPVSPNVFVINTPRQGQSTGIENGFTSRGFHLATTPDRVPDLTDLAHAVGADSAEVLSLEEMDLPPETTSELNQIAQVTFIPPESVWVRMGEDSPEGNSSKWFLRRADAQLLALALLQLDLYPQGYLLGGTRGSLCRQMLCNASASLPQLLGRLIQHVDALGLQTVDEEKLLSAMQQMIALTINVKYNLAFYTAIHGLDKTLQLLSHPNRKVDFAIGVLTITNAEFRAMLAQSARHMSASIRSSVELDFRAGVLMVQGTFGIIQPFPVDFSVLFPNEAIEDKSITLKYTTVILAALKASLRSASLHTSMDSLPLFEAVMGSKGLVYFK